MRIDDAADERAPGARSTQRPGRIRIRPAATVRVGQRSRMPGVLVALTVAFLTLAVAKPWAGPPGPHLLVQGSFDPVSPAPPLVGGASAALQAQCGEPLGWTVVTRERWNGQMVRAWRAVEPAVAVSGPLDADMPLIRVGQSIAALGYCSPWTADQRPPGDVTISAWRIVGPDPEHPLAAAIRLDPLDAGWPTDLGALFRPTGAAPQPAPSTARTGPPTSATAPPTGSTWALGRYVFALRAGGWQRWWAVTIPIERPA